tara:strand:+ start:114 stop:1352 length:1239 start_codon:yes stop_codon:yes gene_type:complete
MQLNQKINSLGEKLLQLLLLRVGFWADQSYDLSADQGASAPMLKASLGQDKWIQIIGREHYYESVVEYPIGNLRDLKKALKIEPWSFPYEGVRFVQIDRVSTQSHRVTNWVVKRDVLEHQKFRPMIMVPETACLQAPAASGPMAVSRLGKTVLVINTDNGLLSGIEPHTEDDSAVRFWRTRLLSLSGLAQDSSVDLVSEANVGTQLIQGLWRVIKMSPLTFLLPLETSGRGSYPWSKVVKMTLLAAALYLPFSSLYILMSDAWVDYKLVGARSESMVSLELRKDIKSMQAEVNDVAAVFSRVPPLWVTWDVVMDLLDKDVTIRRIDSIDGLVTITATAPKATDILSYLSNDLRVAEVKYTQPVRQSGQLQSFAIAMRFNWSQTPKDPQVLNDAQEELVGMPNAVPRRESADG